MKEKIIEIIINVLGFIVASPALLFVTIGKILESIGIFFIYLAGDYIDLLERFGEYCEAKIK